MPKVKTKKGISKTFKLTRGNNAKTGKIKVGAINRCHRMIKKDRQRVLNGKKATILNAKVHARYRKILAVNN
jgi:ribosomal protein L35